MEPEFKNKAEFIKFIVNGISEIIGEKNGEEEELSQCTEERMKKLDGFLSKYRDHVRFFEIEVPSIISGLSNRFSNFAKGETETDGVISKRVLLDDIIIMDKSGIILPTGQVTKSELLNPPALLQFCVECLLKLYQKYVSSARDLIDGCNDEETAAVVARTYHMLMSIGGAEDKISLRSLNLMIMGDAGKAAEQTAKYLDEIGIKKSDAIIQILPIHDMRRMAMIIRSKGMFFAGCFKYNSEFKIDREVNVKECFADPDEFAKFVENNSDSQVNKATSKGASPKFSSKMFFN